MSAAYVLMNIRDMNGINDVHSLHQALHAVPGVKSVHLLTGPTDVITYVEAKDETSLMDTIGKLRGIKGVSNTDTRIVMPM